MRSPRRFGALVLLPALLAALGPVGGRAVAASAPGVRAGVGVVDATWHAGSSAGQYATPRGGIDDCASADFVNTCHPRLEDFTEGDFDVNTHAVKRIPSYGVQSRLSARAIVIEGADGTRIALLKTDNYLAQDVLLRRVGQLLADGHSGVTYDHILYNVSHDHSSPYYTTPTPGPMLFQDVVDLRMIEYQARAMAEAIERAAATLVPVRMGATTVPFDGVFRNAPGPSVADDGSPTGYPSGEDDTGLVVMRFDDVSDRAHPKPLVTWMNFGVHPEDLDGYNLISADYIAPLQRMVGRATGAPLFFSQGDVGSSEPANSTNERLANGVVRAFSHDGYAQSEREARLMSDAVLSGWNQIGAGGGTVPYSTSFPVRMFDRWTPGPVSHPYPAVSNCRTQPTVDGGSIGIPVLGLPDCSRDLPELPTGVGAFDGLKSAGVPIPENYDAPSFLALEENLRIHLQAVRLGDVLLASCSCEPQVDLIKNLESRTDDVAGNIYDGFAWERYCDRAGNAWKCADPRKNNLGDRSLSVSDAAYRRMVAEVHNDARGWDDPANAATANAEPADPVQIKGNFTKEELPPRLGYKLAVGVGHAGDYNGYTVSYRMFMSYDHYRKALTSYGPHTADYMVTRLVRMAGALKGGPAVAPEPLDALGQADEVRQQATAVAVGQAAAAAYSGWHATLPEDPVSARVVTQPRDITRFSAASVTWVGGNNYVDNPTVRVERFADGHWQPYADQTGEVQVRVDLPKGAASEVDQYTTPFAYKWTANFEAPDFFPRDIDPRGPNVPDGRYRFVVDGVQRVARGIVPYRLTSSPFAVKKWTGIAVAGVKLDPAGTVAVNVAPIVYPKTYRSSFKFIADDKGNPICKTCTFRPWASTGSVASVTVRVLQKNGKVKLVPAHLGPDGLWHTTVKLQKGERAAVASGGVVDSYGEVNGHASQEVRR